MINALPAEGLSGDGMSAFDGEVCQYCMQTRSAEVGSVASLSALRVSDNSRRLIFRNGDD